MPNSFMHYRREYLRRSQKYKNSPTVTTKSQHCDEITAVHSEVTMDDLFNRKRAMAAHATGSMLLTQTVSYQHLTQNDGYDFCRN